MILIVFMFYYLGTWKVYKIIFSSFVLVLKHYFFRWEYIKELFLFGLLYISILGG